MRPRISWTICLIAVLFAGSLRAASELALTGGTIYVSRNSAPIANGSVLVRDGKIVGIGSNKNLKIPTRAEVIDCHGKFIVAGFWNSHVHILTPALLNAEARPSKE